jgi:AraC-like DNA-binding protein
MIVVDRGCSGTQTATIMERPRPQATIHDHGGSRTLEYRESTAIMSGLAAHREPVTAGSGGVTVAATALAVFPNTAMGEPTIEDRRDAHRGTLRRAMAFIEAHADQDISIADIARASNVSTRAVQLAFRRHLDTTPTAYLRRVRLDHAHRDLRNAAAAVKPSRLSHTGGASPAPAGLPSSTARPSASRPATPCTTANPPAPLQPPAPAPGEHCAGFCRHLSSRYIESIYRAYSKTGIRDGAGDGQRHPRRAALSPG